MAGRFSHRDPLTERVARTVRDTVLDPHAYSEGKTEPQLVDVVRSFPHAARVKRASAWQNVNTLHLHRVDTARAAATFAPAPAEACTDVGAESAFGDTPGSARATRRFWGGLALLVAVGFTWWMLS
jgi:hypothetical protein